MRLLHTSDWHLGQHFMGKTRQAEHKALIHWLLQQVEFHQIDCVLIAGDIFDTGTPPSYARELYHDLIAGIQDLNATLIIVAGNHDAPATLAESQQILARLGCQVVTQANPDPATQVKMLHNKQGQAGALLCAIPFLRPRDISMSQAGQSAAEKSQALLNAIREHYDMLVKYARNWRTEAGLALPIIATGHLSCVGASNSEAVREIYVGNLDTLPLSSFPELDYLALGHIHKAMKPGGLEHIRYSGSPIPLSFDELSDQKQMLLVEFQGAQLLQVQPLLIPRFQAMASLRCQLKELPTLLAKECADLAPTAKLWLELVINSDTYLSDLHNRVQTVCQDYPVELLRLRRERTTSPSTLFSAQAESLDQLDVAEVFERRLSNETLSPELTQKLRQEFHHLMQQMQQEAP